MLGPAEPLFDVGSTPSDPRSFTPSPLRRLCLLDYDYLCTEMEDWEVRNGWLGDTVGRALRGSQFAVGCYCPHCGPAQPTVPSKPLWTPLRRHRVHVSQKEEATRRSKGLNEPPTVEK